MITFTGTVTGDIEGSISGAENINGIDTLYGIVTGTGATLPVRIIGIFPQSGINGDFVGQIITGAIPTYVDTMTIHSDADTVNVGATLPMTVTVTPEGASNTVNWSVWANNGSATNIAFIDINTGMLTGLKAGTVTVIAKALDGSLKDATKIITVEPVESGSNGSTVTITASDQAATPPTVTTGAASAVGFTTATLNGSLTSVGSTNTSVSLSFGWKVSGGASYTVVTAVPSSVLFSVSTPSTFTYQLTDLLPGTTYDFEAMAQGGDVDPPPSSGAPVSFTTAKITTLPATGIGAYTATLNGHLDIGSASSVAVSFGYSTDTSYTTQATATPSSMSTSGDFSGPLSVSTPKGTYNFKAVGTIGDDISSGGKQTVILVPVIGISVSPTSINFGTITAGHSSAAQTVTVQNTGDYNQNFTTTLANDSSGFYAANLTIGGTTVTAWNINAVITLHTTTPGLVLSIPKGTPAGAHTATIIFWAQSTP
jgi:hypothetical protein